MTDVAVALAKFFGGFGLPAFVEGHVPDDADLPYITYTVIQPEWDSPAALPVRVWYRGTTFTEINAKVDQISNVVGEGVTTSAGKGFLWLTKENPFAQHQPYDNPDILVAYLNMGIQALC